MHLPVGVSNFRELITNKDPNQEGYLFIDKTLLIKELIYDLTPVIVLTRPRRFGKTLNLSMLRHFFAAVVEGEVTKGLFDGLNISKDPTCMQHQGQYPVIFITLKDAKYKTFDLCLDHIKMQIANVYSEYRFLLESKQLDPEEQSLFKQFLENKANPVYWNESIKYLTTFIKKVTGQPAIILIDEYDTPIQEAYLNDYYDQLISFMRNLLSSGLKDNGFFKRAILTGILRVSKESLFSGLSNVETYSILDQNYSSYFGFTEDDTNELLTKAKLPVDLQQTKQWYNGYTFGGTTIYNPWSIIKFIKAKGEIGSYWIHTSGNELIKELVIKSDSETQEKLGQLIAGQVIKETIDEHIIFQDLEKNRAAIWSLFLMTGYLKALKIKMNVNGDEECELAIPNKEVESLYKRIIREWLSGSRGIVWYQDFLAALVAGRVEEFEHKLQNAIEEMASYHDTSKTTQEIFYQGLMLGILSGLKDTHEIRSNRESGKGRYDLIIIPKNPKELGIIMEFKAIDDELKLEETAMEALLQIKRSKYTTELQSRGVTSICCLGIAFSGKAIKIATE
jgi:hypothetical protein